MWDGFVDLVCASIVAVVGLSIVLRTTSSAAARSVGAGPLVSVLQNRLLARDAKRPTET
jgi:hypothetical protein